MDNLLLRQEALLFPEIMREGRITLDAFPKKPVGDRFLYLPAAYSGVHFLYFV